MSILEPAASVIFKTVSSTVMLWITPLVTVRSTVVPLIVVLIVVPEDKFTSLYAPNAIIGTIMTLTAPKIILILILNFIEV